MYYSQGDTSSDSDSTTLNESTQYSGLWVSCSFNETEDRDIYDYRMENYYYYQVQAENMMAYFDSDSSTPNMIDYSDKKFKWKKGGSAPPIYDIDAEYMERKNKNPQ